MLHHLRRISVIGLAWLLPAFVSAQAESSTSLQPPFGDANAQTEPILFIAVIIQALLGIVGAAALLMFIWGGLRMIFSGGNEDHIKKGKSVLLWAVIGMAVILSSYAVLQFTFSVLRTASSQ